MKKERAASISKMEQAEKEVEGCSFEPTFYTKRPKSADRRSYTQFYKDQMATKDKM